MQGVYIEYLGNSLEMPYGETIVGRDVKCALRFNDPAVSRRHLRLIRRQDEVFIEDLGSSNGTLLNGRKVAAPLRIEDGDRVQFGSRELTIRITDESLDDNSTLVLAGSPSLDEGPSTLVLRASNAPRDGRVIAPAAIRSTQPMAVVSPPPALAHQRCPRCAAPVTELDDECPSCHYNWGSFRPMSRTDVRPTAVTRRRHERQPIELRLVYVSANLEIEAMTRDLSESGVFVCSQVLDAVGTSCHLTILVDGGPPLAIDGVVRRVVEHVHDAAPSTGLGVQFVGVGATELDWIRAVIARMKTDEDAGSES